MQVTMDMSSYEIERGDAPEAAYGEEVMYSGWNPMVALAVAQTERGMTMPSSLAVADAETFLEKMYACQR